uniref:Transposase, MuDR, MULE transposase domain protein n=1 Tax=Tanacetum cinerariifolium TaxID=118510 RepID=A0A6L2NQA4_TANCI|nr:transposase, MuDR, MULE transposase domain protein [Tanacetum cinerariifolium]
MDTSKSSLSSKFSQNPSNSSMDNSKRYAYGKGLPLKLSISNKMTYSEILDMLVYKLECEIRALVYFIPRISLETSLTIVESSYYFKNLTFDEAHGDIQSKVTSHEKLKSHGKLALMTFDESRSWEKEQPVSPLLRTLPLKKRRKGIAFQRKNLYADFLHADYVDDHFDVLNNWSYEDVYGGGCFDVSGTFKGFDCIEEPVGCGDVDCTMTQTTSLKIDSNADVVFTDTKQKVTSIKDVEDLQVRIENLKEIFSYLRNRKLKQKEVILGTDDETSSKDDTSLNDNISSSEDLINYLFARDVEWQLPKNTQEEPPKPHYEPIKTEVEEPSRLDIVYPHSHVASSVMGTNRTGKVHYGLRSLGPLKEEMIHDSAKVETVNGDVRLQALADGKKIIVNGAFIGRDLRLDDAEGTACLPNDTILEELTRMSSKTTAWNEFSSTIASAIICLAKNQKFNFSKYIFDSMMKNLEKETKFLMYHRFVQVFMNQQLGYMSNHKRIFVNPSHTKKVFRNIKREGKGFSGALTPLFEIMMVEAHKDIGKGLELPADPHPIPIVTQSLSSQSQKKQKSRRKQRKETEVPQTEAQNDENVTTPSNDPLLNVIFDTSVLDDEVVAEKEVSTIDPVTTVGEVVTTADVEVSAATTAATTPRISKDELTMA